MSQAVGNGIIPIQFLVLSPELAKYDLHINHKQGYQTHRVVHSIDLSHFILLVSASGMLAEICSQVGLAVCVSFASFLEKFSLMFDVFLSIPSTLSNSMAPSLVPNKPRARC